MKVIGPMIMKEVRRETYIQRQHLYPFEIVIEILTELRKLEGKDIATQWWQLEEADE